jgi:DUF4097 and DUF4098 domain-containing protein YvlB
MSKWTLKWALVLGVLSPWAALAGEAIERSWGVSADAKITVENTAGKIVVQGWDRNEVHLSGELGKTVKELEINESSNGLEIIVDNRNERDVDPSELILKIPVSALITATAVSADIEISGLDNAKLTASSVSGDVSVSANSQWVSLETVSGDIGFSGASPRISAESVSGDIELNGISGMVDANTVSGDMELHAGELNGAKLETVSGDILMIAQLSGNGKLGAQSMSGDVTVKLPASQAGSFKAQSFSGRISTDFGKVSKASRGPGSHLKYSAGEGGAEIKLESFSGNIRLQQQ